MPPVQANAYFANLHHEGREDHEVRRKKSLKNYPNFLSFVFSSKIELKKDLSHSFEMTECVIPSRRRGIFPFAFFISCRRAVGSCESLRGEITPGQFAQQPKFPDILVWRKKAIVGALAHRRRTSMRMS